MSTRPALRALADRVGVLSEYRDYQGGRRETSDQARVALLAAMGIDASSEAAARAALERWDQATAKRLAPPVLVGRVSDPATRRLRLSLPIGAAQRPLDYELRVEEESGREHLLTGRLQPKGRKPMRPAGTQGRRRHRPAEAESRAQLTLPVPSEPGYHRLALSLSDGQQAEMPWIVCPDSCLPISQVIDEPRRFGIWTHLYTLRSRQNWGVGDLSDLDALVRWTAQVGGCFVGLNPLHALRNQAEHISPYSPVSRLYRNPLYLDVTAVPELGHAPEARRLIESERYRQALAELRRSQRVDYQRVMELKRPVLQALHRSFAAQHRDRDSARGRAYAEFLERQGRPLTDFASFWALADHLGSHNHHMWPDPYRDPTHPDVERFRADHFERVDYYRYLQFELDRQLTQAARAAELSIGLYGDLAIGTSPEGSDPWAFPGLFLDGVYIGAPPDEHSDLGQEWGLPPVDPRALRADGYRYWILLLRNALDHMGALRIDHVMGLFRQYWVPAGRPATEGAYMRFPAHDLLAILALESRRSGAVIIGEDLGTVPRGLPARLARWNILSSRVLYFERSRRGTFRPARQYSPRALVTANTHDHPPLAGYWAGRDLELRYQTGILDGEHALEQARQERQAARRALLRRLAAEGCLPTPEPPATAAELSAAVHAFLSRTPSPVLGIWLDDLTGEVEPVNVPGTGLDQHPNWSRRSSLAMEQLRRDPQVARTLQAVSERAGP